MAALGDNLIESSPVADGADLNFVDHVESKIHSPDKESFSPTKPLKRSSDLENAGDKDQEVVKTVKSLEGSIKDIVNESGHSDSGLDSSNSSEEVVVGHFVERQESHTSVDEPESIKSPVKTINDLFSFIDEPQSLDAVNNNSDQNVDKTSTEEPVKQESVAIECYQGKEVDLHETKPNGSEVDEDKDLDTKENVAENKAGTDTVDSANMNLYWYSSTLDVDPAELEQFTNGEDDNKSANAQIKLGENYYKDKLKDSNEAFETAFQQDINPAAVEDRETREKWSPAFESASSRFLDLASEMKTDTLPKEDDTNQLSQSPQSPHPWGLDNENKVVMLPENGVEEQEDELPIVSHLAADVEQTPEGPEIANVTDGDIAVCTESTDQADVTDGDIAIIETEPIADVADEDIAEVDAPDGAGKDIPEEEDDIDETDAMGYMACKDKDKIVEGLIKTEGEARRNVMDESQTDSDLKIESEHIVSSVVQKAHCQVMSNTSDSKSDELGAVARKDGGDTVDGTSNDSIIPVKAETTECSIELKTEGVSTAEGIVNESEINEVVLETVECTPQEMVYSEPPLAADVEISDPMEVRRKFRLVADVEDKLIKLGAKLIEVENFIDEYLDDESYSLCLSDCWLRLRNKKFEMKVNEALHEANKTSIYNELTNENDMKQYLLEKYGKNLLGRQQEQDLPLDVIVDKLGFTEFATFETVKKCYQLEDVQVDLELTDFGLQVCEVEAVADRPSQVLQALDAIKTVALNLDLKPLQGV